MARRVSATQTKVLLVSPTEYRTIMLALQIAQASARGSVSQRAKALYTDLKEAE